MSTANPTADKYYIPHGTQWPIIGSLALLLLLGGFATSLNGVAVGTYMMYAGGACLLFMLFGWFGTVIRESESGIYNKQVDMSFRMGMGWFIFSEVLFFAAFFGALFYGRVLSVPWLGGAGSGASTNEFLHPNFAPAWPTNGPADVGGAFDIIPAMGLPALNTVILLTSGVTVTLAHWAIKKEQRPSYLWWMIATVALGGAFVYFQATEYAEAYQHLNLTLGSGIYGSTFFMLTGFHGLHVSLGAIMLAVMLVRGGMLGHFTAAQHFGFEAAAWYWHFVDVVWLGLFIFVYWF